MYVWEAVLDVQYEKDRNLGLFQHKPDAKRACQRDYDQHSANPSPLAWQNVGLNMSRADSHMNGCPYFVTKRRVQ